MKKNADLLDAITRSMGCQRNWDLTKNIPNEDIEVLKASVTNCTSRQNRVFYKCFFITDRNVIRKMYDASEGHTWKNKETGEWNIDKNPQVLGNLLVVFVRDRDLLEGKRNLQDRQAGKQPGGSPKEHPINKMDEDRSLGIAVGCLTLSANILGYATGCCQCNDQKKMQEILGLSGKSQEVLLTVGVGYPQEGVSRLLHHETGRQFNTHSKNIIVEDI
jgi:hypothetical protein